MTFLFTDLRNSTALYERLGDAAACEIVRQHFGFLSDIVLGRNGAVVKTIGDAVMAAFDDPFDAVTVALSMQARITDFNRVHAGEDRNRRVAVRIGVHAGECVRVELDARADYFGSAVNLAARLRERCRNGDVVLSHVVAELPGIRHLLATLPIREESLPFRGFAKPVRFVRVMPATRQAIGSGSASTVPLEPSETELGAFFALGGH
jgi:class 3 adenylate cyclase